jgi:hypothetical protein
LTLDVIQEKNLTEIIDYALEYPSMVLSVTKGNAEQPISSDFVYGVYVGYITGLFFDRFLSKNKRFLNDDELSDFHSKLASRSPEIMLKIKAHLKPN